MSTETTEKKNSHEAESGRCTLLPSHRSPLPKTSKPHRKSSSLDSNGSDFDEPIDSEVLLIKKITSALKEDLTQKLKKYKKLHQIYMKQSELLSTQALTLQEQQKFVVPINKLKEKTCEITEKLKKATQSSKLVTEDDNFSLNYENFQDILFSIRNPNEELKESVDLDFKVFHDSEEKSLSDQTTKENNPKLESESKSQVCSCIVF